MLNECILILAVSIDTFIVALSCGTDGIRFPVGSAVCVGTVGAIVMCISIYCSDVISMYVSNRVSSSVCCAVLCAMGGMNIVKWTIQRHRRYTKAKEDLLNDSDDTSMLDVFICGSCADCDHSKEISIKEAVLLSLLMSVDTLVCGITSGSTLNVWHVSLGTLVFQSISIMVGSILGQKCIKFPDISFVGGILLIALGVFKVI